jgi:hypothetical protein
MLTEYTISFVGAAARMCPSNGNQSNKEEAYVEDSKLEL